jgi:hypothetical protein
MCFSAAASFGAGFVLTVIGRASMKKIQYPSEIFFACIPLIFAVQQIAEGILWLTLPSGKAVLLQKSMMYLYLVIAQIIWPVWVPMAVLLLEKEQIQKQIQKILLTLGSVISLYMIYCLFNFKIYVSINHYHISYTQEYPQLFSLVGTALYVTATVGPTFLSNIRYMRIMGTSLLLSYIVSILFYEEYLVSVWCFFASIISVLVYLIIQEIHKSIQREFSR